MSCPEIQDALRRLGFESPHLAARPWLSGRLGFHLT